MNLVLLLQNKKNFTTSEKYIADYILAHNTSVLKMSTKALGKETYTSPATIVRLCQKLGFDGFDDFKITFSKDYNENILHTDSIDYNYPFSKSSTTLEVIESITKIKEKTIEEMRYLLDDYHIEKAVQLIQDAQYIDFYGYGTSLISAFNFEFHMNRLNKNVQVRKSLDSLSNVALRSDSHHLAIIISYSGDTTSLHKIANILKLNDTPIITITSMTENKLKLYATLNFPIVTKESLNSKIGTFSSNTAVECLLDILYATYYKMSFDDNTKYLLDNARKIEERNNQELKF